MSLVEQAKAALQGVTPGPWVVGEDCDKLTVGAGTYLKWRGCYTSTDLILENDLVDDPAEPGADDRQRWVDAGFIAAARTLVPALISALESWCDVAHARQVLIDQLKAEKRLLAHEVNRLGGLHVSCLGCGNAMSDNHECKR